MGLIDAARTWARGIDPMEVADAVRRQAEEAGPPPAVRRLGTRERQGFDRLVDALNRLPRPILTFGTLGLLVAAVAAPAWFTDRMHVLAQLPESVWWMIGAVLGLHFGARAQDKAQAARIEEPATPQRAGTPASASTRGDANLALGTLQTGPNAALDDWRATQP